MADNHKQQETWHSLFDSWQEAKTRGQDEKALEFLVELATAVWEEWSRNRGNGSASHSLLLLVLERLAAESQAWNLHEAALCIYSAIQQYAREQNDVYGALYFGLRSAQSCIALLDFHSATRVLSQLLGLCEDTLLDDPHAAIEVIATLTVPHTREDDLHLLRIEALLSLSRYLTARGRLGAADVTLCYMLALLKAHAAPTISTPDVYIWLAEVRLDRGDFAGVEALYEATGEHEQTRTTQLQWLLLQGQLWHLQGRFSEADTCFRDLTAGPHTLSAQPLVRAAVWQRIHVLAALNRLDEAEALLESLAVDSMAAAIDIDGMRTLLKARRSAATTALHLPPPSQQMLVPSEHSDVPFERLAPEAPDMILTAVRRTRERVRDDYSRLFNSVLLALHDGHADAALLVCTHLSHWTTTLDSKFIVARQKHLWALVSYYANDSAAAEEYAADAYKDYGELGMLGEQWAMCRVMGWSLHRRNALQGLRDQNRKHMLTLQEQLMSQLAPEDQALYALNKWSTVDEEIAAICHNLYATIASSGTPAGAGRYQRWRLRRAARQALQHILRRRGLHYERGTSQGDEPPDTPARPEKDVYRLALENIRRRLSTRDSSVLVKHLAPGWLPADMAVLHYVVLPDRLELFLITNQGCELIPLRHATSRPDLWEKTRATLGYLRRAERWNGKSERLGDLATRLGFSEIATHLPSSTRHLAIVPDDILVHVPFAALPVDARPCIAQYSLAILPALLWHHASPWEPRPYASALGVAVTASAADASYPPLENAAEELHAMHTVWGHDWQPLADGDATCERVKRHLSAVEIVHFACHGDFFPENPDKSGLLLHDGWLTLDDIYTLHLDRLSLAVLASCWGASTMVLPGDVHIGLPFALLDRGAWAVVASLWEVSHATNIPFTGLLYEAIATYGPILGLAMAQRLEWERHVKPAAWAGYVTYAGGIAPRQPIRWLLRLLYRLRRRNMLHQSQAPKIGATPR